MARLIFRNARGISLLELMLVLLIIAIIIFTSIRYYQVANENLKVAQAVDMINNIVNATGKWLEGQPQLPPDFSIPTLVNAGLLPSYYATVLNPWKGDVYIGPTTLNPTQLTIVMYPIPKEACQNLASKVQQINVVTKSPICVPSSGGYIFTIAVQY